MKSLKWFCIIGAVTTIILGIVSHFVYDWTGGNFFVGLFFPVNESTWEHMKLLYFPLLLFALVLGWVPANGAMAGGLILPVITLSLSPMANITRLTRSSMLDVLGQDYIRTARAKGLRETAVVLTYALKNAAPTILTVIGQSFGSLVTGTIVTETLGATAGATALGMSLGGPEYGIIGFANSVWVITLNTWGFFIVNLLFAHKIEDLKVVVDRYDTQLFSSVALFVMIGCVTKFLSGQVVGGISKIAAAVAGFVIMLIFLKIAEKKPKFGEFALGLAMLLALFIAQAVRVATGG